uniref:protein-serine/threonine phosphatase n=1 Tax=Glossina brevipalpis TaxID=37001 RepID=A0A1A9X4D4_9MUSC
MGAYLSQPKTEKESTDESNDYLVVGACSMQGWRNSQEDAHNSILTYDTNASFFAVYDGHGGAEVSTYCSDKFPAFLKTLSTFQEGAFEQALKDAFLGFDKTLLEPEVIEFLKVIAGEKNFGHSEDSDGKEDDDDEDLAELHEEGNLPLDEVMEKYKGHPSMPALKKLKENSSPKPQSPCLRGRRAAAIIADAANKAVLDPDSKPEGSSTSKAALAAETQHAEAPGPSSTKSDMENDSSNSNNSAEAEAKTSSPQSSAKDKVANGSVTMKTTVKESEQNGSVSSSKTTSDENDKPLKRSGVGTSGEVTSNEADCEPKQNGSIIDNDKEISTEKNEANDTAITSTSKEVKEKKKVIPVDSSEEEDADFDARQAMDYSSDDEGDGDLGENDSEDSEDAGYDEEEEEDESCEDEDEETFLANENFCANMIEEPGKDSGCTAVVSLLIGRDLYVANAGDSRCVVCRNGKAIEMSLDHKPEDDEESARIIKAGGTVTIDGRVCGGLNLSRAIGDHGYKTNANLSAEEQMISALPDVKKLIITPEDEFMVLACDGIWNFMSSEEVVQFVRLRIKEENKKISQICEELFDACLAPNTMGDGTGCDNMTAVIVRFKPALLKLSSKINPEETEDVLQARQQQSDAGSSPKKGQKRASTTISDDNGCCEAESKRVKTDKNDIDTTASNKGKDDQQSSNTSDVTTNTSCSSSSSSSSSEDKKDNEGEDACANEAQAVSDVSST